MEGITLVDFVTGVHYAAKDPSWDQWLVGELEKNDVKVLCIFHTVAYDSSVFGRRPLVVSNMSNLRIFNLRAGRLASVATPR